MALGDGIRRNVAKISQRERDRFRDAFVALRQRFYADGVSKWFKQDEIHQATHVHAFAPRRGIAFLPWHREITNRLEALLREIDPQLSLHYWDWTTDPRASDNGAGGMTDLFTPLFMGSPSQRAGQPFDAFDNAGLLPGSRDHTGNPADPPQIITRSVGPGAPAVPSDLEIIRTGDSAPEAEQYNLMRAALEGAHNTVHSYIGGTISNPHASFQDPFVFLLHSNVDRLFATWQAVPGRSWRLDPERVYGNEGSSDTLPPPSLYDPGILTPVEPWAGNASNDPRVRAIRPWAAPDNEQTVKNYKHPSIVLASPYDTSITEAIGAVVARHNLTSAQHQQAVIELLGEGFRPMWVSGYTVGGLDRYASIWEQRPGPAFVLRHNLTSAQHQQTMEDLVPQGFRPTCVSGYTVGGQDRYASIWEQRPGPAFVLRHNLTSAQHQQTVEEQFAQGFRPTCVSGYGVSGQDRYASLWEQRIGPDFYASIWERAAGPQRLARHNLTSAQHQQTVEELFAQGFQPTCVSGYSIR